VAFALPQPLCRTRSPSTDLSRLIFSFRSPYSTPLFANLDRSSRRPHFTRGSDRLVGQEVAAPLTGSRIGARRSRRKTCKPDLRAAILRAAVDLPGRRCTRAGR
jgi:hypothetical protein